MTDVNADFLNFPKLDDNAPSKKILPSERFFNRELSWISFNQRVLEEASNEKVPLLERLRFLAISARNLDEFYSVRVAGFRQMVKSKIDVLSADGLTPEEQLLNIEKEAKALIAKQQKLLPGILRKLQKKGINVIKKSGILGSEKKELEKKFISKIFPALTPLAIDPAHPFPFIPSEGSAIALRLKTIGKSKTLEVLVPMPGMLKRFQKISDGKSGEKRFLPLETLIVAFIESMFPGYKLEEYFSFRILRDSDLEVEEEAEDLVREFEIALKRRKRGEVIRMKITKSSADGLVNLICKEIGVDREKLIEVDEMIGLSDLDELITPAAGNLKWKSFVPRSPERIEDFNGDIFSAIKQKDLLLQHPYETFDIVVSFLEQAARDPNVIAIKQTLYRTTPDSPIVKALCEAAENGKTVTALVELKARFDEANNINVSRNLEKAGAQVVYGFMDWKTHAKLSNIVRKEGRVIRTYTHIGTGNYHPDTAKIYTDLSLFTSDPALGRDVTKVFNYLSGYIKPVDLENLTLAPLNLKTTLIALIEEEIKFSKESKPAEIWIKLNALIDPVIIDMLYKASNAGVRINMIVRGICGLRPGIKGLSENIRVKSVIGRFLEHSRVSVFGNGNKLPSNKAKVFISSADWMGRNLNRRVESFVEITNSTVKSQIVNQVMAANLADKDQSWVLQSDGKYKKHDYRANEKHFSCHEYFIDNPSMSGRGQAASNPPPNLQNLKS
ncbi:RNA degradosome polyphosphate kinase [bacterium TMED277]|nr:MAG: RNA degradosome polyphosphate kinase [bacterium TMED277]